HSVASSHARFDERVRVNIERENVSAIVIHYALFIAVKPYLPLKDNHSHDVVREYRYNRGSVRNPISCVKYATDREFFRVFNRHDKEIIANCSLRNRTAKRCTWNGNQNICGQIENVSNASGSQKQLLRAGGHRNRKRIVRNCAAVNLRTVLHNFP